MSKFKSGDLVMCIRGTKPPTDHILGVPCTLVAEGVCVFTNTKVWSTEPPFYRKDLPSLKIGFSESGIIKIEDRPGEDETFQWAGKPIKEEM